MSFVPPLPICTKPHETVEKAVELPPAPPPYEYDPPAWAGIPITNQPLRFEVLKNGVVVDLVDLVTESMKSMNKSWLLVGRLPTCDIELEHPSVSRYHAIIQMRSKESALAYAKTMQGEGSDNATPAAATFSDAVFVYDLASTHGTELNKSPLPSREYTEIVPGMLLKFGASSRVFVLQPFQNFESGDDHSVARGDDDTENNYQRIVRKTASADTLMGSNGRTAANQTRAPVNDSVSWGMQDYDDDEIRRENGDLESTMPSVGDENDDSDEDEMESLRGTFGDDQDGNEDEQGFSNAKKRSKVNRIGAHQNHQQSQNLSSFKKYRRNTDDNVLDYDAQEADFQKKAIKQALSEDADIIKRYQQSLNEGGDYTNELGKSSKQPYYLNDPKKAMRTVFERENVEMEFSFGEEFNGSNHIFVAKLTLPVATSRGYAAIIEGRASKKKEAERVAALAACKFLDQEGLLQKQKKSIDKKPNFGDIDENDMSDNDSFYDRTGEAEKKRKMRLEREKMLAKDKNNPHFVATAVPKKVYTYETLLKRKEEIDKELLEIRTALQNDDNITRVNESHSAQQADSLDAFMSTVAVTMSKETKSKLKRQELDLTSELKKVNHMIDIAKPSKSIQPENNFKSLPVKRTSQVEETSTHEADNISKAARIEVSPPLQTETFERAPAASLKAESLQQPEFLPKKKAYTVAMPADFSQLQKQYKEVEHEREQQQTSDAVWLPPVGQTGDGKTKLNEKFAGRY